ncbi:DUF4397 domain-containing protein [Pedobacter puniceum]|uniref:DUF4397 domain-containing protein n=1 Tax=Pedobacter puniceum TaxID=2666136 RepID=A0A7K0FJX4_9SPHI|nr:DUF4397 domain-containing protein [Pedobacter puniceum]MRX46256.1 DUF4397 domain-containing protein [Pedobacter puniceum]
MNHIFKLLLIALLFTSCSSEDGSVTSGTAQVNIINVLEGSAKQDIYFDDVKSTMTPLGYLESTGYSALPAGNRKIEFKNTGTAFVNSSSSLRTTADRYYTYFFSGGSQNTALQVEDSRTPSALNNARIRFIHFSYANQNTGITVRNASDVALISNLGFKTASSYIEVEPGSILRIFPSSGTTPLLTTNYNFLANKNYTLFISGNGTPTFTVLVNN